MKHKQWENTTKILKYNERKQIFTYIVCRIYWINMAHVHYSYRNTNQFHRIANLNLKIFSGMANVIIWSHIKWIRIYRKHGIVYDWAGYNLIDFLYQLPFSFTIFLPYINSVHKKRPHLYRSQIIWNVRYQMVISVLLLKWQK